MIGHPPYLSSLLNQWSKLLSWWNTPLSAYWADRRPSISIWWTKERCGQDLILASVEWTMLVVWQPPTLSTRATTTTSMSLQANLPTAYLSLRLTPTAWQTSTLPVPVQPWQTLPMSQTVTWSRFLVALMVKVTASINKLRLIENIFQGMIQKCRICLTNLETSILAAAWQVLRWRQVQEDPGWEGRGQAERQRMTQPQCWFPARWRDNSPPSKLQMWAPTCQRSSRTANK